MPDNVNELIANFPSTLQLNALRSMQAAAEQQKIQANALALQQQQAGLNALRGGQIDPNTGLPTIGTIGNVIQADPQLGESLSDSVNRAASLRSRAALTDLMMAEHNTNLFDQNVVVPLSEIVKNIPVGTPPEQRDQIITQQQHQLIEEAAAKLAIPNSVKSRWENLPRYNPVTWDPQSEILEKRRQAVAKGWHEEADYGRNPPTKYFWNDVYGPQHAFAPDFKTTYIPTDIAKPAGKPENYLNDIVKDDKGNIISVTPFTYDSANRTVDRSGNPYTVRGTPTPITAKGAGGATYGTPENYKFAPGTPGGDIQLAFPPKDPLSGEPWRGANQQPLPPPIGKATPSDLAASGASDAVIEYMAERDALGYPMGQGRTQNPYNIRMSDTDIHRDLNLPPGAPVTREQARDAAAIDVARRVQMHGDAKALATLSNSNAIVSQFEGTVIANMKLIEANLNAAGGPSPLLNKAFRNPTDQELRSDPALAKLAFAVYTVRSEYVKIMSSAMPTGGQMTTNEANAKLEKLFNIAQPEYTLRAGMDIMRPEMENRVNEIRKQYNSTLDRIKTVGGQRLREEGAGANLVNFDKSAYDTLKTDGKPNKIYTYSGGSYTLLPNGEIHKAVLKDGKWSVGDIYIPLEK